MARKDLYLTDYSKSTLLEPIEAKILGQYQLLAIQLSKLSTEIKQLNVSSSRTQRNPSSSSSEDNVEITGNSSSDVLLDNLRNLEMKIGLVYTLFRGAVYSLFLQYEEDQNLKNDEAQRKINSSNDSFESTEGDQHVEEIEGEGT